MGNFRRRTVAIAAILAFSVAANSGAEPAEPTRSVNISNSWLLPQNDFPVFYRHFKDRVTWFEADAVCQFHHAQLVTVESTNQFEAVRRYLKELDVTENVWIGLKRNSEATEFTWTNYQPLARSGYFREEVPRSSEPVCVVADPTANFKWHSLHCGGPEVASFVCELPVPNWASKSNGCMTNMVEGMTVTFLPEHPAIQLAKECSPGVSKNVTCKGNMEQSEIIEQLSCPNSNKLLKTLFKPVKSNVADVKPKTTTSSSESEVEDYVEMATIAQYNDETFQSISKVMGGRGTIGFPQEMSIAQEPIEQRGRNGFDTNGIDSAFIAAAAAVTTSATTTAAVTASATAATVTASATAAAVTTSATAAAATADRAERKEPSATTANAGGTVKPAVATTTTAIGDAGRTPTAATATATAATTTTAAFGTPVAAAKTSTEAAAPTTAEAPRRTTATSGRAAAPVTWDPIRVYKKIDLPQLYDVVDFPFKPAPVTTGTAASTNTAAVATTAAAITTVATAAAAITTVATAAAAITTTARANGTRGGDAATVSTATAAAEDADSSGPAPTASYATATGDNATASGTVTAAAAATAATASHRKSVNYESYADDRPNRSRHIVRPKQQHHHSYPYILYRLLG